MRALKIPIVASGGIGDGRGMAAALALGAQGINMGTRFMCTQEAPIHDNVKQALVAAGERDTNLMFRTMHNTARVLKNAISERSGRDGEARRQVRRSPPLSSPARAARSRLRNGDVDGGIVSAGMVIGLIDDVPTLRRADRAHRARLPRALAGCDRDGRGLSGRLPWTSRPSDMSWPTAS